MEPSTQSGSRTRSALQRRRALVVAGPHRGAGRQVPARVSASGSCSTSTPSTGRVPRRRMLTPTAGSRHSCEYGTVADIAVRSSQRQYGQNRAWLRRSRKPPHGRAGRLARWRARLPSPDRTKLLGKALAHSCIFVRCSARERARVRSEDKKAGAQERDSRQIRPHEGQGEPRHPLLRRPPHRGEGPPETPQDRHTSRHVQATRHRPK